MGLHTEPSVNVALADALRPMNARWEITAENTRMFRRRGLKPDIAVRPGPRMPLVILETEFEPATTVELDASQRLDRRDAEHGRRVEQVLAVQLDPALRKAANLPGAVSSATYKWCVLSPGPQADMLDHDRWPPPGHWLEGSLDALAQTIENVSLSDRLITKGLDTLEAGVLEATNTLRKSTHPERLARIAACLHQTDGKQTSRMAMAILANALVFHERLARHYDIAAPSDLRLRGELGHIDRGDLAVEWGRILAINYLPIFEIARDLLAHIADMGVVERLARVAAELARIGAVSLNDLSGRLFQQLIVDRKFLATFYTLPNSATLLAELAVPRLGIDWSDPQAVKALRIGDFACGTGALLLAAYQGVLVRHRHEGRNDVEVHAAMMEHSLIAADIMPAATHLTTSNLAGVHPSKTFDDTPNVHLMPYGRTETGIAIGSLDLMDRECATEVPELDLAIMNPPFTRPTSPEMMGADSPVPSFAGFETTTDEQAAMSQRLGEIGRTINPRAGHGNAGLASNFIDLAHAKTKAGGQLALVLPASCVRGASWANARQLLATEYTGIVVVSIATTGQHDRAFSADTGMAEVLLVARKGRPDPDSNTLFVNLERRPESVTEAADVARAIRQVDDYSGWLYCGSYCAGSYVHDTLTDSGAAGVRNPDLVRAMQMLANGLLHLPRLDGNRELPITPLGTLGTRGPVDRDVNGWSGSEPRGPWDIVKLDEAESPPTWPALWAHDAEQERRLIVEPDRAGRVRPGCRKLALARWETTASRLHFNRLFQINSQSLIACLTPEPAIGGHPRANGALVARYPHSAGPISADYFPNPGAPRAGPRAGRA